jgi:cytochrome oxidase Cu insertion factor (SCO1/SenC/PrrC family)
MRACVVCLSLAALLIASTAGGAQPGGPRDAPPDEDRFLNEPVPDIAVTAADGTRATLSSIAGGKPILFTFAFTRCGGACPTLLASWRAADRAVRSQAVHRLVLSFDRRDTTADMAALADHLDLGSNAGWTFAVAAPEDVQRLADATGFWYEWDTARQQFDHPAMIAAARDGRLVRLLVGGIVSSARLDDLVREASGAFVASYPLPGRVLFRCVQFDASTGRVALDWGFLLLLVPVAAAGLVTSAVFLAGARRRRVDAPRPQ